jgi:hypothetical protein
MARRKISIPAAYIPGPPSKAKRDRSWEKQARQELGQVTYRGVPVELRDEITRIASELHVTTGEVARAMLEYALQAYLNGDIDLNPVLFDGKLTLYPGGKFSASGTKAERNQHESGK